MPEILACKFLIRSLILLLLCLLVPAGCGKSNQQPAGVVIETINWDPVLAAFASVPDAQPTVRDLTMSIRATDYPKALADLDALGRTPSITEQQTKVIADLSSQIHKKMDALAPKQ